MNELEKAAERISFLYEKILDNQDWEISELDELLDLSRKDGIEWQAKQSPWISVEDRLPDENQMVLCQMQSNNAIVSAYIYKNEKGKPQIATSPSFEFEDYQDYEPSRWMPIPE